MGVVDIVDPTRDIMAYPPKMIPETISFERHRTFIADRCGGFIRKCWHKAPHGAALRAVCLSAELGRRAERLRAVAPKPRAKAADTVVDRLLNEDALVASRGYAQTGMSDLDTMAEGATKRRRAGQVGESRSASPRLGDRRPNDHLFDRELDHLPPEARWREWMNRVEADFCCE